MNRERIVWVVAAQVALFAALALISVPSAPAAAAEQGAAAKVGGPPYDRKSPGYGQALRLAAIRFGPLGAEGVPMLPARRCPRHSPGLLSRLPSRHRH